MSAPNTNTVVDQGSPAGLPKRNLRETQSTPTQSRKRRADNNRSFEPNLDDAVDDEESLFDSMVKLASRHNIKPTTGPSINDDRAGSWADLEHMMHTTIRQFSPAKHRMPAESETDALRRFVREQMVEKDSEWIKKRARIALEDFMGYMALWQATKNDIVGSEFGAAMLKDRVVDVIIDRLRDEFNQFNGMFPKSIVDNAIEECRKNILHAKEPEMQ